MSLLTFHEQALREVLEHDGVVLLGSGLGQFAVVKGLLRICCTDPQTLVRENSMIKQGLKPVFFLLNGTKKEELEWIEGLADMGVKKLPVVINNEYPAERRRRVYMDGGVFITSPRILIVDLLNDIVNIDSIGGLIIVNAETITEEGMTYFVIRVFQDKSDSGFLKVFSEKVTEFESAAKVEQLKTLLRLDHIYLWPRVRNEVQSVLDQAQPDVVGYSPKLTDDVATIQHSIVSLLHSLIDELNRYFDFKTPDFDAENLIFSSSFEVVLNDVGNKSIRSAPYLMKQYQKDAIDLWKLLSKYLLQCNGVTFLNRWEDLRSSHFSDKCSNWLIDPNARSLFNSTFSRVYAKQPVAKGTSEVPKSIPVLERNNKLAVLLNVLKEITETEQKVEKPECSASSLYEAGPIIIIVSNKISKLELLKMLKYGEDDVLKHEYKNYLRSHKYRTQLSRVTISYRTQRKLQRKHTQELAQLRLQQLFQQPKKPKKKEQVKKTFHFDSHFGLQSFPFLMIVTSKKLRRNPTLLERFAPRYIILYEPDLSAVYKSSIGSFPVRVYFLCYENSFEQAKYVTSVEKEKQIFNKLSELAKRTTTSIKNADAICHEKEVTENKNQPIAFVDMREFRCSLPLMLYQHNIKVIPTFLGIGDYIIAKEICVERKGLSDLFSSFSDGRIYEQASAMCDSYEKPILLIEWPKGLEFNLQGSVNIDSILREDDIEAKLCSLILRFPKLRLVWSQSPETSAKLLQTLMKEGTPVSIGDIEIREDQYLSDSLIHAYNFLEKLPGISQIDINRIALWKSGTVSLHDIGKMSLTEMTEMLGSDAKAKRLYEFINRSENPWEFEHE